MKIAPFDQQIILARPKDYRVNKLFTDTVMKRINEVEILSSALRKMNVTKKETFMMKLKHLPKIVILAIAVGTLALLTGTTYAVVKTIENLHNVKVNETSINNFGRQQLDVTLTDCSEYAEKGVGYELKRDGGLSIEDGARTLQARCDMAAIDNWFKVNSTLDLSPPFLINRADTIISIDESSVTLKLGGRRELSGEAKVISAGKEISKSELKAGDTVFSYPDVSKPFLPNTADQPLKIFLLTQPVEFYGINFQSYVNERGPCQNNPSRQCLKDSNNNHVVLIVERGGFSSDKKSSVNIKEVQGKVAAYDSSAIQIDVGGGVIYTIQTPSNIIERYNKDEVYKLAEFDGIYAKTNPEDLKISKGDSLEITYVEDTDVSSDVIDWSQQTTIQLMIERLPHNLDVLRKY